MKVKLRKRLSVAKKPCKKAANKWKEKLQSKDKFRHTSRRNGGEVMIFKKKGKGNNWFDAEYKMTLEKERTRGKLFLGRAQCHT